MPTRRLTLAALGAVALAACAALGTAPAAAQAFPNRAMRLIVPFPAGSASDSAARILAKAMSEQLKQPITVENKPGANGILGVELVKNAAGDPYTLLVTASTTHAANLSLYKQLPYDPVKDFVPLAKMGVTAFVLMVRPNFPANTAQEFLSYARANTGKLSYGHGTAGMLASGALLSKMGQFSAQPVAYKGNPPAMMDLMGGVIDFSFVDVGNASVQMKAGKLKGLGITMVRRTVLAPDLPTLAEAGLPGFEIVPWVGLLAPARIPEDARAALESAAMNALARPDVKAQFVQVGLDPEPADGAGLARTIDADIRLWARVLADAGVKPE
ncbi:Bug family tripartite tricarboxylate transporter substrate binding protein [Variovorax sp. M-6]|uniref:Bug family tripartite tricarboxylate transporter substrate binding protein n=1 Tax=Variovorax sp. M-6 TaxID=3233041 RepID=UPI003F959CC0